MDFEKMSNEELWALLDDSDFNENEFERAHVLGMLCMRHGQAGELAKSLVAGYAAIEIFKRIEDPIGEAAASYEVAASHDRGKEYILAIPLLERAVELYRSCGTTIQLGRSIGFLANVLHSNGQCAQAAPLRINAIELLKTEEESRSWAASTELEQGECYLENHKAVLALEAYERAKALAAEYKIEWIAFQAEMGVGSVWRDFKDFAKAAEHFKTAYNLASMMNAPYFVLKSSTEYGGALNELGRYKKAEKVLSKAIENESRNRYSSPDLAITRLHFAHTLLNLGELKKAKKLYERLHDYFNSQGDVKNAYICSFKLATMLPNYKRDKAIAILEEVARESIKHNDFFVQRASRVCLAELLEQSERKEDKQHALEMLTQLPDLFWEDFKEYGERYKSVKDRLMQQLGVDNNG